MNKSVRRSSPPSAKADFALVAPTECFFMYARSFLLCLMPAAALLSCFMSLSAGDPRVESLSHSRDVVKGPTATFVNGLSYSTPGSKLKRHQLQRQKEIIMSRVVSLTKVGVWASLQRATDCSTARYRRRASSSTPRMPDPNQCQTTKPKS